MRKLASFIINKGEYIYVEGGGLMILANCPGCCSANRLARACSFSIKNTATGEWLRPCSETMPISERKSWTPDNGKDRSCHLA
jgi:hypothetical protein